MSNIDVAGIKTRAAGLRAWLDEPVASDGVAGAAMAVAILIMAQEGDVPTLLTERAELLAELTRLRAIPVGGRPAGRGRDAKTKLLATVRAATGLTNMVIAAKLGIDPSYLTPGRPFPVATAASLMEQMRLMLAPTGTGPAKDPPR